MELPQIQRICSEIHQEIRRICGWGSCAIQIGRQQATVACAQLKALLGCGGVSDQYFCAVEGAGLATGKGSGVVEDIVGYVYPSGQTPTLG